MTDPIVVVTWNVQGRGPKRLDLDAAMAAWNADILLLQEADGDALFAALPDGFPTRLWWPDAGYQPGIVIASRFGCEASGVLTAGDSPSGQPRTGWARLRIGNEAMAVASVHLLAPPWPGTPGRRRAQAAVAAGWAEERISAGERVVVGGDFNTINPSLDPLADASASAPKPTWRPLAVPWMRPILRLDAIFVARSIAATGRTDDRWRGSDHCPVVARIGR
jgi:endonuclease/exonuclease/phosphatase family metal-dependent hydrolase